jgi:putative phosphoesterase
MRIGLIADIHGNLFALREALTALDRHGVDRIVCLGDVASPGPWPAETIALLMERDIPAVRGNTDDWLLAADPAAVSDTAAMNAINAWVAARLELPAVAWLTDLPLTRDIDADDTTLTLFHGSPRGTEEVIAATTPKRPLAAMLDGVPPGIAAGGHTHLQMLRTTAAWTVVNPGSIGLGGTGPGTPDLPPSRPVRAAELAVLEVAGSAISVTYLHLPLDTPAMLAAAAATGMPGLESWSSLWRSGV